MTESDDWGECYRCNDEKEWGVTLYDDHAGFQRHKALSITLCADCRDDLEDWLGDTEGEIYG